MKLYFSGVAGREEMAMLADAGVRQVLVDPTDRAHLGRYPGRVALDSGAYRCWRRRIPLDIPAYLILCKEAEWDFAIAPDVIGDPAATWENWTRVRHLPGMVPVWHWSADQALLRRYLDERPLVAIGALVPLMNRQSRHMLRILGHLCRAHPGRFHILGMNWVAALERLKDLVHSCDTSKWLDGGRRGVLIYPSRHTGRLALAPRAVLHAVDWDRRRANVANARNLDRYFNRSEAPGPPAVC